MSHTDRLRRIVRGEESLRIDISAATRLGYFLPLTELVASDDVVVQKMTRWRNENRQAFLTQFEATDERTRRWLQSTVVTANDRLLLLLYTAEDVLIGQYGFTGLSDDTVELDNLIRGERGGDPSLIHHAEHALVDWLFAEFPVQRVVARVLAGNPFALQLHYDCGFMAEARLPLRRTVQADEVQLTVCGEDGDESPDGCYQVVLVRNHGT